MTGVGDPQAPVTLSSRAALVQTVTGRRRAASDPGILRALLGLHAVPRPRILDVTYGRGQVWRGLPYRPTRMDINPALQVDVVGDWQELPDLFPPAAFDVVVWDPLHVTDSSRGSRMFERYMAPGQRLGLAGPSIAPLYGPFLDAARPVLEPRDGIVLAKLCDQVHASRQQWQLVDFVNAAQAAGFTACDYAIKPRSSFAIDDPKWTTRYHLRKAHAFWVVARTGPSCLGPGIGVLRVCRACGAGFRARRSHAQTCSDRCRQRLHRQGREVSSHE